MYAVIRSGSKQQRVSEGERLEVDHLAASVGEEVSLEPVLVVDGNTVLAGASMLTDASVSARVVGEAKGPKITGFVYRPKSNNRRRWGHRQRYTTVEITGISTGSRPTSQRGKPRQAKPRQAKSRQAKAEDTKAEDTKAGKGQKED